MQFVKILLVVMSPSQILASPHKHNYTQKQPTAKREKRLGRRKVNDEKANSSQIAANLSEYNYEPEEKLKHEKRLEKLAVKKAATTTITSDHSSTIATSSNDDKKIALAKEIFMNTKSTRLNTFFALVKKSIADKKAAMTTITSPLSRAKWYKLCAGLLLLPCAFYARGIYDHFINTCEKQTLEIESLLETESTQPAGCNKLAAFEKNCPQFYETFPIHLSDMCEVIKMD